MSILDIPSQQSHERRLISELNRLREQLATMDVKKAILFGSLARGDVTIFSDIDLIIVQDTGERFLDRLERFYTQLDLGTDVDILVYTPEELIDLATWNPLVRRVLQEGEVIYEAKSSR
jgi:predicted nucleotidyltransferase